MSFYFAYKLPKATSTLIWRVQSAVLNHSTCHAFNWMTNVEHGAENEWND